MGFSFPIWWVLFLGYRILVRFLNRTLGLENNLRGTPVGSYAL